MGMNWEEFDKGIFLVNVLAIIYDRQKRQILIGKRESDQYIKELSWVFPGGRPGYQKDLEDYVVDIVKEKTGLLVRPEKVVFAKTYPEKREFLSAYYLCEAENVGQEKTSSDLVELKWVKPSEVADYFTTSLHPKLLEYLKTLD